MRLNWFNRRALAGFKAEGSDFWNKFSRSLEIKLRYEWRMLSMLRENWEHPLLNEYEKLIREEEQLSS